MADYKFALKLHQDKAGSENAKAKITIGGNVVAAELEITPESAAIYTYDVTGLADENSNGSVTTLVKVELLNDYFVDTDNDRKILTETTIATQIQQMTTGHRQHSLRLKLSQILQKMLRLTGPREVRRLVTQMVTTETTALVGR